MFEDDEFDFGGDEAEDPKPSAAAKRSFGDLEDDDEELFPPKKQIYGATLTGGVDHATTTIINLRASLEERDDKIASLQGQVEAANLELERWRKAFQIDSILPSGTIPEPEIVLQVLQKSQASEGQLKDQIFNAKRREGAMLVKLSNKEQQIVQLKTMVHDLKLMMKPPAVQARRLLLDPAIHAEFMRMKKELEAAEKKIKELQDDLGAVQFTPHSKNGKMLMAKCRTLQEENEEIGREASEGKIHELGTKLAMQKSLNVELKRGYQGSVVEYNRMVLLLFPNLSWANTPPNMLTTHSSCDIVLKKMESLLESPQKLFSGFLQANSMKYLSSWRNRNLQYNFCGLNPWKCRACLTWNPVFLIILKNNAISMCCQIL